MEFDHWWIGPCNSVGINQGDAWLEPRLRCPSDVTETGERPPWREGGTDIYLSGGVHNVAGAGNQ
jgi:hypothetical protein